MTHALPPDHGRGKEAGKVSNVTDLDQIRRKRKNKRLAKAILLILGVLVVLYGAVAVMQSPDFAGLASLEDLIHGGSGYPVEAPGGQVQGMYSSSSELVVVNETNLFLYSASGSQDENILHRMTNPQVVTRGNMVLSYDRGGRSYAAYNRSTAFAAAQLDDPIRCADITANGEMAIATQQDGAKSVVTLYDRDQKVQMQWQSTTVNVSAVALSDDANLLAVSGLYVENGVLKSRLTILQGNRQVGEKILEDQMILDLRVVGNQVMGVTDQGVFLCDKEGTLRGNYLVQDQPLAGFALHDGGAVLMVGDYEQNRQYTLLTIDNDCSTVRGRAIVRENLQSLKVQGNTILVLGGETLSQYSLLDCQLLRSDAAENIYSMQPMGNYVYLASTSQLSRISLADPGHLASFADLFRQAGDEEEEQQSESQLPTVEAVPGLSENDGQAVITDDTVLPDPADLLQQQTGGSSGSTLPTIGESTDATGQQPSQTEPSTGTDSGTASGASTSGGRAPQTSAQPQEEGEEPTSGTNSGTASSTGTSGGRTPQASAQPQEEGEEPASGTDSGTASGASTSSGRTPQNKTQTNEESQSQ